MEALKTIHAKVSSLNNWLNNDDQVKNYMYGDEDLVEYGGVKKAFKTWKVLPKEKRTEKELYRICRFTVQLIINQNDIPD